MDVAIVLDVPESGYDEPADYGDYGHQKEEVVPAEMVGEPSEADTGEDDRTIAHEADETHSGRSSLLGRMLDSSHSQHRLGSIDEETGQGEEDKYEHRTAVLGKQVKGYHAQGYKEHLYGADPMGLAFEEAVGHPSGTKHPYTPRDFENTDRPAGELGRKRILPLLEEHGAPVQDGETDYVHEEVGYCQAPDNGTAENPLADKGPERCRTVILVKFGASVLQLRQSNGLGCIPQGKEDEQDSDSGDSRREYEAVTPITCLCNDVAAEDGNHGCSYRMGGVPDGRLCGEFLRRHPMGKQPIAGREAAALEYIVENQKDGHDHDHRVDEVGTGFVSGDHCAQFVRPAEEKVQQDTGAKADDKVPAGIDPVCDYTVQELGHSIDDPHKGKDYSEAGVGDSIFSTQGRHGEREILAHEIEHGVADHRADHHLPLP